MKQGINLPLELDGEIVGVKESNKSTADSVKSSIELLAAKYGKTYSTPAEK